MLQAGDYVYIRATVIMLAVCFISGFIADNVSILAGIATFFGFIAFFYLVGILHGVVSYVRRHIQQRQQARELEEQKLRKKVFRVEERKAAHAFWKESERRRDKERADWNRTHITGEMK